jgi:hypothetical protein
VTYPFVQAANDYGRRKGPVLAFVIHMAEGGGTVGFLSRPNVRGVSVHYVIERSGRIVQMLLESHASGSIDPTKLRDGNGPPPYGISVARATLGGWVNDPNSAVLSVEIEGYAADGPNPSEVAALKALVKDIRTRYPAIGLLGHRDFVDYKACPGAHIPWDALGGHGPAEDPAMGLALEFTDDDRRGVLRFTQATPARVVASGLPDTIPAGAIRRARAFARAPQLGGAGWIVGNDDGPEQFVGLSVAPELEPWPGDADETHTVELRIDGDPVYTREI